MHGPPGQDRYYNAYQLYKSLEVATPIIELILACVVTGYLKIYQERPENQPNFIHRILKIILLSDTLIMLVLLWQMFDTTEHTGKAWIFYH